jgi:D-proline reductase (dithiol) PrdB
MLPADLPLTYRLFLRTYRWRRAGAVPAARLRLPVTGARIALVTSAGLVMPGDTPFDLDLKGGDWSYRTIDGAADPRMLSVHHKSDAFDRADIDADRNVAFPLARLRDLAAAGEIGAVAPRHLSFMGSITAPGRLQAESAPGAADQLAGDGVDIALLVPV